MPTPYEMLSNLDTYTEEEVSSLLDMMISHASSFKSSLAFLSACIESNNYEYDGLASTRSMRKTLEKMYFNIDSPSFVTEAVGFSNYAEIFALEEEESKNIFVRMWEAIKRAFKWLYDRIANLFKSEKTKQKDNEKKTQEQLEKAKENEATVDLAKADKLVKPEDVTKVKIPCLDGHIQTVPQEKLQKYANDAMQTMPKFLDISRMVYAGMMDVTTNISDVANGKKLDDIIEKFHPDSLFEMIVEKVSRNMESITKNDAINMLKALGKEEDMSKYKDTSRYYVLKPIPIDAFLLFIASAKGEGTEFSFEFYKYVDDDPKSVNLIYPSKQREFIERTSRNYQKEMKRMVDDPLAMPSRYEELLKTMSGINLAPIATSMSGEENKKDKTQIMRYLALQNSLSKANVAIFKARDAYMNMSTTLVRVVEQSAIWLETIKKGESAEAIMKMNSDFRRKTGIDLSGDGKETEYQKLEKMIKDDNVKIIEI